MSGFEDTWLALREPADDRSRDPGLVHALAATFRDARAGEPAATREAGGEAPTALRVLDLGAGTGSNFRHLAPRLGARQSWTLVDHDAALLDRVPDRLASWTRSADLSLDVSDDVVTLAGQALHATLRRRRLDLASGLDTLPFADSDLVTGSALLDLAGGDWLDALAARCARHGCAAHFVLSYDGRLDWTPAFDDDEGVAERFDRHQRQDKGLGLALGPDAAERLARSLERHGLAVSTADSPWRLGVDDGPLQRELTVGLARAAGELDPDFAPRADAWLAARLASIDARRSTLLVGHTDVLALPSGR